MSEIIQPSGSACSAGQALAASIGADGISPIEWFHGTIDEVSIYNYALSATQVVNHYNAGSLNPSKRREPG